MDVFFEQLYHFLGSDYIPKRFGSMIILPWRFYTLVHKSSMGQIFFYINSKSILNRQGDEMFAISKNTLKGLKRIIF